MSAYFGFIMFLCVVPSLCVCFYQLYPKKWKEQKLIFGVKNRPEFLEGEGGAEVEKIVGKYHGMARNILIVGVVISVLLLLLKGTVLQLTVWTMFTFLILLSINIPFLLGNKDLKDYKRRLGLGSQEKVNFVDLRNAGAVHALKPVNIIVPNVVGLLICLVGLLMDLRVIPVEESWFAGSFLLTGTLGLMWLTGVMISVLALVMDGFRSEVISTDSDVNANYNRAKKKILADFSIFFLWVNTFFLMGMMFALFINAEMLFIAMLGGYLIVIMAGTILYVLRQRKIEEHYKKEASVISDDDDNWLGGLFYYNPSDNRLNVEKRVGVGGTVNMAHPMGKVFTALGGASILLTVVLLVWIGMLEGTPLQLSVKNEKVVCHQLRDEYVISVDKIESLEWGDIKNLRLARIMGIGMDDLCKGEFFENKTSRCKVFLKPSAEHYIKIMTKEHTYYITAETAQQTQEAYQSILELMK